MKGTDNNSTQSYYDTLKADIESQALSNTSGIAALTKDHVMKLKMAQILITEGKATDGTYDKNIDNILNNETIKTNFADVIELQYDDIKQNLNVQEQDFGAYQGVANTIREVLSTENLDYVEESDIEENEDINLDLHELSENNQKKSLLTEQDREDLKEAIRREQEKRSKNKEQFTKVGDLLKTDTDNEISQSEYKAIEKTINKASTKIAAAGSKKNQKDAKERFSKGDETPEDLRKILRDTAINTVGDAKIYRDIAYHHDKNTTENLEKAALIGTEEATKAFRALRTAKNNYITSKNILHHAENLPKSNASKPLKPANLTEENNNELIVKKPTIPKGPTLQDIKLKEKGNVNKDKESFVDGFLKSRGKKFHTEGQTR